MVHRGLRLQIKRLGMKLGGIVDPKHFSFAAIQVRPTKSLRAYETLHTVSHLSHKALSMTWYYFKMHQHSHMLGFGVHSLRMTACQSLSEGWNCTGMAFSQGSLVSQFLLPALASMLQHSAGCSKALVRSLCICKDAKQCIMMYHVQFMEVHNPHMDATPTRSM